MAARTADGVDSGAVSLAQVEDELRAAEAYLHHFNAAASEPRVSNGRAAATPEESAARHQHGDDDWTRAPVSGEPSRA